MECIDGVLDLCVGISVSCLARPARALSLINVKAACVTCTAMLGASDIGW